MVKKHKDLLAARKFISDSKKSAAGPKQKPPASGDKETSTKKVKGTDEDMSQRRTNPWPVNRKGEVKSILVFGCVLKSSHHGVFCKARFSKAI